MRGKMLYRFRKSVYAMHINGHYAALTPLRVGFSPIRKASQICRKTGGFAETAIELWRSGNTLQGPCGAYGVVGDAGAVAGALRRSCVLGNVCFWHLADIDAASKNVRSWG
jgi:hypothetical protein